MRAFLTSIFCFILFSSFGYTKTVGPTKITSTVGTATLQIDYVQTASDKKFFTQYTISWISDSSQSVKVVIPYFLIGEIAKVSWIPDNVDAPTDAYDTTLTENGVDLLFGKGLNKFTATPSSIVPLLGDTVTTNTKVIMFGYPMLNVSNAGVGKKGLFSFILEK